MSTGSPRCGRSTSTGRACKGFRLEGFEACVTHLNATERQQYTARKEEQDRFWQPLWQRRSDLLLSAPSCWSWPVSRTNSATALRSATADAEISAEDTAYTVLATWQAERCAICGEQYPLVVDHDHRTGLVRGLLCRQCNTNEGMDGRPGTVYQRYRELPPTRILGVRIRYWDPITRERAEPVVEDAQGDNNPLAQIGRKAAEGDVAG